MRFSQQIKNFTKTSIKKADTIPKIATIELFGSIIKDTPVLDGYLRGGWRASFGAPDLSGFNTADTSGGTTQSAMTVTVNSANLGDTLYFSNPLPYGPRIEYEGYSGKAPEGMVRKNIARFQGIITAAVIKAR